MNQPQVYMYPLLPKPSSHLPPHHTPLGCHKALAWGPCVTQQIHTWYLFYITEKSTTQSESEQRPKLMFLQRRHQFSSAQFSRSVVSDSLRPHESQHARPPCPSPTPGVPSNSRPSSQWCHPVISSSVIPFSSCSNPSQHPSLFQWVNSSHEVAKVLEFQL